MKATTLSRIERTLRPLIRKLPPRKIVSVYSRGRVKFMKAFENDFPEEPYIPPESLARELWGLRFRTPIMNSAGMFKDGECPAIVEKQGAGAYLGGTGTFFQRKGVTEKEIHLPFEFHGIQAVPRERFENGDL
ncbi:MAG: hypothetical protein IIA45_04345 [Bacteroidetes bacterium]|nr:hypothetical protein [Bacteroidota bacterium]